MPPDGYALGLHDERLFALHVAYNTGQPSGGIRVINYTIGTESYIDWPFPDQNGTAAITGSLLWWLPWRDDGWPTSVALYDLAQRKMLWDERPLVSLGLPEGDFFTTSFRGAGPDGAIDLFPIGGEPRPGPWLLTASADAALLDGAPTHAYSADGGVYYKTEGGWNHTTPAGTEFLPARSVWGEVLAAAGGVLVVAVHEGPPGAMSASPSPSSPPSHSPSPSSSPGLSVPAPWSMPLVVLGLLGVAGWSRSRRVAFRQG